MKRVMAIALVVVLSLLMLPAAAVSASPPTEVSGTFELTSFDVTKAKMANGNMIFTVSLTTEWTGDFVGTDEGVGKMVFHPNGDYTIHTFSTWTGSYLGGPEGTMVLHTSNKGNDFTGVFKGRITVISSTDGLAGLHGVLTITNDPLGGDNIYSGKIHFDP